MTPTTAEVLSPEIMAAARRAFARQGAQAKHAALTPQERSANASRLSKARWDRYRKEQEQLKAQEKTG